jgi:MFS family permease
MLQARAFFYRRIEYKNLVAIAFVFGLFMDILDSTIINVALPQLGRDFNAGTADLERVVTGYLLSLAIWIPASGWIGDKYGTKKTFLFATAMFLAGSMLCGLSHGPVWAAPRRCSARSSVLRRPRAWPFWAPCWPAGPPRWCRPALRVRRPASAACWRFMTPLLWPRSSPPSVWRWPSGSKTRRS